MKWNRASWATLAVAGGVLLVFVTGCWARGLEEKTRADGGTEQQRGRALTALGGEPVTHELSKSPFGLHVIAGDLEGAVAVGARWTRHLVLWKQVEPRKGELRELERVVPRLNELTNAGFEILPRIVSVNPWALPERINRLNAEAAREGAPMGDWTYIAMPTDIAAYRRFLTTVVEAFDGDGMGDVAGLEKGIKYWQIENEWDWRWKDTPEKFVEFLGIAYETIKAADPNAKVVLGGISKLAPDAFYAGLLGDSFELRGRTITPASLKNQKHFSEEYPMRTHVLEKGHPFFDVISFHQYGRFQAIEKEVEYLHDIMRRHDYEKPLWITEAGGPFAPYGESYSEDRHAREVVKYYLSALASGVEVVFWSTYQPTPEWGKAFTNTALVERGRKKPAYQSYKVMAEKLSGAVRVERLASFERGLLVRFTKKGGDVVYAGWHDGSGGGEGGRRERVARLRTLVQEKLEGKTLEVTWYDGEVKKVTDVPREIDQLLGRGPAFIEIR